MAHVSDTAATRAWRVGVAGLQRAKKQPLSTRAYAAVHSLDALRKTAATLDKIQNSLEDYLEKKKMAFPRFYFLSNDELLEILAQSSRNPQAVQPHPGVSS